MTLLQALAAEFHAFKRGTRARALFYLRTGMLSEDAPPNIQIRLDHWTCRLEKSGGLGLRRAVLRALEEAGAT